MYTENTAYETGESTAMPVHKQCAFCGDDLIRKEGESVTRFRNRKYCNRQCAASMRSRQAQEAKKKRKPCQVEGCTEPVGEGKRFLCDHHFHNASEVPELPESVATEELDTMEFLFGVDELDHKQKQVYKTLTVTFTEAEYKQDELEFYKVLTPQERREVRRYHNE